MANVVAKERNKAIKGRTGFRTKRRRKRQGLKCRPWGKCTPPGHHLSPTDIGNRKLSGTKKKKES